MPESNLPPDEPQVEPTVRELLVAEIDATCRRITLELDRLNRITAARSAAESHLGSTVEPPAGW